MRFILLNPVPDSEMFLLIQQQDSLAGSFLGDKSEIPSETVTGSICSTGVLFPKPPSLTISLSTNSCKVMLFGYTDSVTTTACKMKDFSPTSYIIYDFITPFERWIEFCTS